MNTAQPVNEQPSLSVVLVDDQPLLRAGFAMVIDSQPDMHVVAQAASGAEALEHVRRYRPEVVLMDIRMPGMDGLQATEAIAADPELFGTRVIVLTTFDTDEYAVRALRAGAGGFLLKDVEPEALLEAIRTVVAGGAVIAPSTTRRLLDATLLDSHGQPVAGEPTTEQQLKLDRLTAREREILLHMSTGESNTEIAGRLYLSEATVKTHVGQVLAKLGCRDRVQAVVFAYEAGIAGRWARP